MVDFTGIGTAVSAVSKLFGDDDEYAGSAEAAADRAQRRLIANRRSFGEDARMAATRSGYSPLTMLGAFGGGASATASNNGGEPKIASNDALSGAIQSVGALLSGKDAVEDEKQRLENAEKKLKLEQAQGDPSQNGALKPKTTKVTNHQVDGITAHAKNQPPPARPSYESKGFIPVFKIDGTLTQIPTRLAERLKIGPWEVYTGGDGEEHLGEAGGFVETAPRVPGAMTLGDGTQWTKSEDGKRIEKVGTDTFQNIMRRQRMYDPANPDAAFSRTRPQIGFSTSTGLAEMAIKYYNWKQPAHGASGEW